MARTCRRANRAGSLRLTPARLREPPGCLRDQGCNVKSPLNAEAAVWTERHLQRLPLAALAGVLMFDAMTGRDQAGALARGSRSHSGTMIALVVLASIVRAMT